MYIINCWKGPGDYIHVLYIPVTTLYMYLFNKIDVSSLLL